MSQKVLDEAGFTEIGIAARPSNAKETTGEAIIPKQAATPTEQLALFLRQYDPEIAGFRAPRICPTAQTVFRRH